MRTFQVKARRFLALVESVALAFVIGFRHGRVFGLRRAVAVRPRVYGAGQGKGKRGRLVWRA
jgi:hypothetical protein